MKLATVEEVKEDIGYHSIDISKCCEKCAFYDRPFQLYGNNMCGRCKYLNASARIDDIGSATYDEVNCHAICKHFISPEQMMQFKQCKSNEELILTLDMLCSADIDKLLLQEIKDGIGDGRKVTMSMMSFADSIEKTLMFETHSNAKVTRRPLMVKMDNVMDNGMITFVDKSDSFARVYDYISANEQFVRRRSKMWKDVMM